MEGKSPPPDKAGQFYTGMIECLIAFGVALDARGLISRPELSRLFRLQVDQHRRNTETIGNQAEFEARIAPALVLANFFELPVSDGPIVIEGGKGRPPEGGDAA